MSQYSDDQLSDACQAALETFKKSKNVAFSEIQSNLEFCIGSYNFDHNPVGLVAFGRMALQMLKDFKTANPRKVNKSIIENLELSLQKK